MGIYTEAVQKLYVAYFSRPADAAGLAYWENVVTAAKGNTAAVSAAFAASQEYKDTFAGQSAYQVINTIYQNLFGRAAEADALTFWGQGLLTGKFSIDNAVTAIAAGAQGTDMVAYNSKVAAATAFSAALDTPAEILGYNGVAANNAAKAWLAGVTTQATLDAAVATAALNATVTSVVTIGANTGGQTLALTSGADVLSGTSANDTFNAVEASGGLATLTVGDVINGGAGNDTLNITQTGAVSIPLSVTLSSIENIKALSAAGVTLDTTAMAGVTSIDSTSVATASLTAAATTDVKAVVSNVGIADAGVSVSGGNNVNLNVSGTTANADVAAEIVVSGAAGAVNVTNNYTGADTTTGADVSVTGGTTITVNQTLGNAVNTTTTQGTVTVTGSTATTAVTVNQQSGTAGSTAAGKVAGAVTIADVRAASASTAGTIATVTLNNYGAATIDSSALSTVNLSGTGSTLGISRGALSATPTANTLTLNVNGLTAGTITDAEAGADDGFTTVNIASTGSASTIADLVIDDATAVNVSGDAKLTLTANSGFGAVTAINVTNSAGAAFGTALGTGVAFTGGTGADSIILSTGFTKAITLGAGDDTVTYATGSGSGYSVAAGEGTDTIRMTAVQADAADADATFNTRFTGFETLSLTAGAGATINLAGINGVNNVVATGATGTLTLNGFTSGGTLTLSGTNTAAVAANVTNAELTAGDVFNLRLSNSTASAVAFGTTTLAGIETVNISTVDAGTGSTNTAATIDTATLVATSATKIVVTGNNGLTLTNTGNTKVTSFDASGVVSNSTNDTAANLGVTFASANNTASATVTITGGAGNDTLTGGAAKDVINGGAGADIVNGGAGVDSITVGQGRDIVIVAAGESTTAASDSVIGFKLAEAIATAADLSTNALFQASTAGGANASMLGLDLGATVAAAVADATGAGTGVGVTFDITDGILTLGGAGASTVDTLGEWLAEAAAVATTAGDVVAFEFGGDTYVFAENGATDVLVKLVGVTGAAGLLDANGTTTTAANTILFTDI